MMEVVDSYLDQKAEAIGSVLFLLEDHFRMMQMGAIRSCISYPRIADYAPPRENDRDERWLEYQRWVSRCYRLTAVSRSLDGLLEAHPHLAVAVVAQHEEIPPVEWWEPQRRERWAEEGLRWMAKECPGDIPHYGDPVHKKKPVRTMVYKVKSLREKGLSYRAIAKKLHMSKRDVAAVCKGAGI